MVLRFIINFVRWSWGYPSLVMSETPTNIECLLMFFGGLIDIAILTNIIILVIFWWNNRQDRCK